MNIQEESKSSAGLTEIRHFINGEFVAGSAGETFGNFCPLDGCKLGTTHKATKQDVDAAVNAARNAMDGEWGKLPTAERLKLLYAVARGIEDRFDDFLEAEIADTGKPRSLASHIDIPRGAVNFSVFANMLKNEPNENFFLETPDGKGAVNFGVRKPKGVIAIISPWNLPLLLMTWKVGPTLACGNAVIVKPLEETPSTATLLGEVMNDVGVPRGVYNVAHGHGAGRRGSTCPTPRNGRHYLTGEPTTGEEIMKAAARGVRDVSLELDGKNPGIIFADADSDAAIEGTMRAVFANCGQVCLGTERLYVEQQIFDRFAAELAANAQGLKLGHYNDASTNLGPLIYAEHRNKVKSYYEIAAREGATIVTGGGVPEMGALDSGWWVEPTIWTGLPDDSPIVTEEIFGPCYHIRPFDTDE